MKEDIVGESGGIPGLVRIISDHLGQVKRVEIDDLVFKETDKNLVSDLFVAALDDFNSKVRQRALEKLREKNGPGGGLLEQLLNAGPSRVVDLPPAEIDTDVDENDGER